MEKISMLEMLEQERDICRRLQDAMNMMLGLSEAAKDGKASIDAHEALLHHLVTEAQELEAALKACRMGIAKRVDDLFAMAVGGPAV